MDRDAADLLIVLSLLSLLGLILAIFIYKFGIVDAVLGIAGITVVTWFALGLLERWPS